MRPMISNTGCGVGGIWAELRPSTSIKRPRIPGLELQLDDYSAGDSTTDSIGLIPMDDTEAYKKAFQIDSEA